MKKFLSYLSLFMMGLAVSLAFVACGDKDGDEPEDSDLLDSLQGTWEIVSMTVSANGQSIDLSADDIKNNAGGAAVVDETLTFKGQKVNNYSFQIDGNRVMLPWYEELGWWAEVSFTGSKKMTMYYDIDYQGVPMKLWAYYTKTRSHAETSFDNVNTIDVINAAVKAMK